MFDTRGECRFSCEYLAYLSPTLNSSHLQLMIEASFISLISVVVMFVWIGVCSISFHVSPLFDDMFRSGTYDGTGKRFQMVIGNCFSGLRTSTWSA
jgi:hypothetical protein